MSFTDLYVKNLKPRKQPYRVWSPEISTKGFGIQVTPAGAKTFFLFYRFNGKRRFLNLGAYIPKTSSLSIAGERFREAKSLLAQGIDPQIAQEEDKVRKALELEKREQEKLKEQMTGSIKQLFDYYTAQMNLDKKPSWQLTRRALYKYTFSIIPEETKAKDIKPQDIRTILFKIVERGKLIQANRVRSYLSAAFNYGIEHDLDSKNLSHDVMFHLENNPVRDVPKPQKHEEPGKRHLSWNEIRDFWHGITARYHKPNTSPTTPKNHETKIDNDEVALTYKVRTENPAFGKNKIAEVLRTQFKLDISESKVGRILKKLAEDGAIAFGQSYNKIEIALKLILTSGGQRVLEALTAEPQHFNFETKIWEIPDTKNGTTHVVPLNDLTISFLKPYVEKAILNDWKYLFPLEGTENKGAEQKPMPETSLSQAVNRFCFTEASSPKSKQEGKKNKTQKIEVFKKFTPRDLRRTCKTRMGEIGISKETRDKIHNHAQNDVSSRHYDYYDYLPQKREALDKWGQHLQQIINGTDQT